jgi:hypothetical protein
MKLLRRYKSLLAKMAGLAMLAHVLAAAFCPNMNGHGQEIRKFDAVLGWVTLCLSQSSVAGADDGLSGSGKGHSGHGNLCAALCAAVVTVVTAFAAVLLTAIGLTVVDPVAFTITAHPPGRRISLGGIGSRAPPALV